MSASDTDGLVLQHSISLLSGLRPSSALVGQHVYLWNFDLCLHAPYISELELIEILDYNNLLFLMLLRIAILSFMQSWQLILPKDLLHEIALPFQRTLISTRSLTSLVFTFSSSPLLSLSFRCAAKCFANKSVCVPQFINLLVSEKC